MALIGGILFITFGVYAYYDVKDSMPQSTGGKMQETTGFGNAFLSLIFEILMVLSYFL